MIDHFTGPNEFLSNFYAYPVRYNNHNYRTAEHAFQAAKAVNPKDRNRITNAATPKDAKRIGRHIDIRSDWDSIRVGVMRDVLAAKFSDDTLRKMLLDTKDEELVEGNDWGDRFWGVCKGAGRNMLGKLLMELRDRLRNSSP